MAKSQRTSAKSPQGPEPIARLDVGKAHADLALAIEEHRVAKEAEEAAHARTTNTLNAVSVAQEVFDAAVEQLKDAAAPYNSDWWNAGRGGV